MSEAAAPAIAHEFMLPQFVKGETVFGADRTVQGFQAANLDLSGLTWPRSEPGPAFDTPISEIIELLVETGEQLRRDPDGLLAEALEHNARNGDLDREILQRAYAALPAAFSKQDLEIRLEGELGPRDLVDGWREVVHPSGRRARMRAFPARLIHILAGNVPSVAAMTIIRGAMTKGVNLLKLPSNDLFTATAILRSMEAIAPGHPVVRSFSAVYWRGGDASVEGILFRPQFFDKLVAWGGENALRSAKNYIGPGFELVAFDPKTSISFVGREAFASDEAMEEAAIAGAHDATNYNQFACSSSRIQFVEGDEEQVDRYCELLQKHLGIPHDRSSESAGRTPEEIREEVDALREMEPIYRVWGQYDGKGLVVRSDEPVDFYPSHKTVNVVPVESLDDAISYVNVATQTVGVYPPERKAGLRDRLAAAGMQRVVSLGQVGGILPGLAHDGFLPMHRFVRWVNDED
jgi:hypothetical protein